jgi:hypothetical protein
MIMMNKNRNMASNMIISVRGKNAMSSTAAKDSVLAIHKGAF